MAASGELGGIFSKDGLFNMAKHGVNALPEEPVAEGDSWKTSEQSTVPRLGSLITKSQLTYVGPVEVEGRGLHRIDVVVTGTIQKIKETEGAAQIELTDQSAGGSIFFDNDAGRLSHSEFTQSMTMNVQIVGTNVQQQLEQTVNVQLEPALQPAAGL